MYSTSSWRTLAIVLSIVAFPVLGLSQGSGAPHYLSFQGRLTDLAGVPVDTPTVSMTFKIYKPPAAKAVWTETHVVAVVNGMVNVILGGINGLDSLTFDNPIDLGITVGDDPEMSPRTLLAGGAFAKGLPGLYTYASSDGTTESFNVVGGMPNNAVGANVTGATISGGGGTYFGILSPNSVLDHFGTIGGGGKNTVDGYAATIGGGFENTGNQSYSTIAGGNENVTDGSWATVAGGYRNVAAAPAATVGGGSENVADWNGATIPGGLENEATGFTSFAAGFAAKARHHGTFVWNDRSVTSGNDSLVSTADNQFLARAANGFTFYTRFDNSTGVTLGANDGSWGSVSDVNAKTGFGLTDQIEILNRLSSVPIMTWRYKGQDESVTHMGPTGQDFYEAFGLGLDEKHIVTVDADGVALAAIQGLYKLVREQAARIDELERRLAEE